MRKVFIIADDFGISPSVSKTICELAQNRRLTGAGCMVIFKGWDQHKKNLEASGTNFQIGLHLTLTDFDWNGRKMRSIMSHVKAAIFGRLDKPFLHAACDLQLDAFRKCFGNDPAFIDGHQHVHLLPPVREWIIDTFRQDIKKPWVRGVPAIAFSSTVGFLKSALLRFIGRGHSKSLELNGFIVAGPLLGFYNWSDSKQNFSSKFDGWLKIAKSGSVIMCHPGQVDDTLISRDILTTARENEYHFLYSNAFIDALRRSEVTIIF